MLLLSHAEGPAWKLTVNDDFDTALVAADNVSHSLSPPDSSCITTCQLHKLVPCEVSWCVHKQISLGPMHVHVE